MIKVVKTISAVLGIMILIGLAALGYALYTSDEKPQDAGASGLAAAFAPAPQAVAVASASGVELGDIALGQPEGSTIRNVVPQGALIYVTVQGGGKADRVIIVDLAQRRVAGQISLGAAEAPAAPAAPVAAPKG